LIPLSNILPTDNCLSQAQIINYLNGTTTALENVSIEHHFTNCDICSQAIDGFASLSNADRNEVLHALPKKFIPKAGTKNIGISWQRIAAIASGLLIASVAGAWYYNNIYNNNNVVAQADTTMPSAIETPSINKTEAITITDNTVPIDSNLTIKNTRPTTTVTAGNAQQVARGTIAKEIVTTPQPIQKSVDGTPVRGYVNASDEAAKVADEPVTLSKNTEEKQAEKPAIVKQETTAPKLENDRYDNNILAPANTHSNNADKAIAKVSKPISSKKQKDIYPSAIQNNVSNSNLDNNYYNNNDNTKNKIPSQPEASTTKLSTAFDLGTAAFKNKNYKAAIVYFKTCLANNLNTEESEYQLAMAYKLNGDYNLAEDLFTKIKNKNNRYKKAATDALMTK
jgi:hypothetical protein